MGKYGGTTPTEFGLSLNSICVNDSYCATGSDDGILRLWPLDFSTVFLEAGKCTNIITEDQGSAGQSSKDQTYIHRKICNGRR